MSEIIDSIDVVQEATTPIKKPRGRPRKPEEEKKKKDKPPRVKKERHHEERAPLKTG